MSDRTSQVLTPSLLLAAGILAGTAIAALFDGFWVLAGPLALALATVTAGWLQERISVDRRFTGALSRSLFLACVVLVAATIIALGDPARVAAMVPILGACASVPIWLPARRCVRRVDGALGRF
ncbi:MAG: hypothetical protein AAF725_10350 [Acidobacteriota bacterium]